MKQERTWCKYGNCSLEKLELELEILNKIWTNLEKNWAKPADIEDVYRIYPLLDTTAALARKMLTSTNGKKNKKYQVEIIEPTNLRAVDTDQYLFPAEHQFYNGIKKKSLLADVVSTFLHGSEYVYMDTRKKTNDKKFEIYIYLRTDKLCPSCAESNLKNPKKNGINYRKTTAFTRYDDCTCGQYIDVRSYINSVFELIKYQINNSKTPKSIHSLTSKMS
jgi:hypothetical protein